MTDVHLLIDQEQVLRFQSVQRLNTQLALKTSLRIPEPLEVNQLVKCYLRVNLEYFPNPTLVKYLITFLMHSDR